MRVISIGSEDEAEDLAIKGPSKRKAGPARMKPTPLDAQLDILARAVLACESKVRGCQSYLADVEGELVGLKAAIEKCREV
jgi:hypothetical protein